MAYEKKLIEGNFPCQQVGAETKRERGAVSALPPLNYLHIWWARRPLTASRAAVLGSILPSDVDTSVFLKELGIVKKQVLIGGQQWTLVGKNIELIEKEKNREYIPFSNKFLKALAKEKERRALVRSRLTKLVEEDPSFKEDRIVKRWYEENLDIAYSVTPMSGRDRFEVVTVPADPAHINERIDFKDSEAVKSILGESFSIDAEDMYGYNRAYLSEIKNVNYNNVTVLDPTAGGGAIPFEALRLGCNVIANDLNPVASAIEIATLQYPSMYGKALYKDIGKYGVQLSETVSKKMEPFFPQMPNESINDYLYCRYVTCPSCGERAPLLNSFALHKKKDGWMVIPTKEGKGKIRFVPVRLRNGKGPNGEDPENGTIGKGTGRCLFCGQAIEGEEIRQQARGESSRGSWSDEIYCVVSMREQPKIDKDGNVQTYASGPEKGRVKTEKVMFFREPVKDDLDALARAKKALNENWERWDAMGLIPTERIPEINDERPKMYGMERWCDMFTPRQLLGLLTAEEVLFNMIPEIMNSNGNERGTAIVHYLQYMIDKCVDYNSKQTTWNFKRSAVTHAFTRHDFSLKWTFAEQIFSGSNSGIVWGAGQVIKSYKEICELLEGRENRNVRVLNGSAANLNIGDKSVDVVCVDPPYYNNVQYAELSDYFYVWQKRIFKELYPEIFSRRLTNKNDEAVANPVRDGGAKQADRNYERLMGEIFAECRRVLKDDGIMTLMFTHKTQTAWETLTRALIENGWCISSAFPVESEAESSTHQKEKAAAASSIFIACRKRDMTDREPSVWSGFGGKGVLPELQKAVRDSLHEYESLHLNAVDEMVASYGSALKVLSENWPVMDGEELVTPIRAMKEAGTVVARYQMTKLTDGRLSVDDFAPEAGVALTLFGIYGMNWFPFDDALSLSKSLNIRLETKAAGYRDEGRMIGINDEKRGKNKDIDEEAGYFAPVIKKGSKLRLVFPEERIGRRLEEPQNEWDIMQGVIMAYREGDIPVARAYLQKHAEGHEDLVTGILQVWADGCASEELKKEARRILYGLK